MDDSTQLSEVAHFRCFYQEIATQGRNKLSDSIVACFAIGRLRFVSLGLLRLHQQFV